MSTITRKKKNAKTYCTAHSAFKGVTGDETVSYTNDEYFRDINHQLYQSEIQLEALKKDNQRIDAAKQSTQATTIAARDFANVYNDIKRNVHAVYHVPPLLDRIQTSQVHSFLTDAVDQTIYLERNIERMKEQRERPPALNNELLDYLFQEIEKSNPVNLRKERITSSIKYWCTIVGNTLVTATDAHSKSIEIIVTSAQFVGTVGSGLLTAAAATTTAVGLTTVAGALQTAATGTALLAGANVVLVGATLAFIVGVGREIRRLDNDPYAISSDYALKHLLLRGTANLAITHLHHLPGLNGFIGMGTIVATQGQHQSILNVIFTGSASGMNQSTHRIEQLFDKKSANNAEWASLLQEAQEISLNTESYVVYMLRCITGSRETAETIIDAPGVTIKTLLRSPQSFFEMLHQRVAIFDIPAIRLLLSVPSTFIKEFDKKIPVISTFRSVANMSAEIMGYILATPPVSWATWCVQKFIGIFIAVFAPIVPVLRAAARGVVTTMNWVYENIRPITITLAIVSAALLLRDAQTLIGYSKVTMKLIIDALATMFSQKGVWSVLISIPITGFVQPYALNKLRAHMGSYVGWIVSSLAIHGGLAATGVDVNNIMSQPIYGQLLVLGLALIPAMTLWAIDKATDKYYTKNKQWFFDVINNGIRKLENSVDSTKWIERRYGNIRFFHGWTVEATSEYMILDLFAAKQISEICSDGANLIGDNLFERVFEKGGSQVQEINEQEYEDQIKHINTRIGGLNSAATVAAASNDMKKSQMYRNNVILLTETKNNLTQAWASRGKKSTIVLNASLDPGTQIIDFAVTSMFRIHWWARPKVETLVPHILTLKDLLQDDIDRAAMDELNTQVEKVNLDIAEMQTRMKTSQSNIYPNLEELQNKINTLERIIETQKQKDNGLNVKVAVWSVDKEMRDNSFGLLPQERKLLHTILDNTQKRYAFIDTAQSNLSVLNRELRTLKIKELQRNVYPDHMEGELIKLKRARYEETGKGLFECLGDPYELLESSPPQFASYSDYLSWRYWKAVIDHKIIQTIESINIQVAYFATNKIENLGRQAMIQSSMLQRKQLLNTIHQVNEARYILQNKPELTSMEQAQLESLIAAAYLLNEKLKQFDSKYDDFRELEIRSQAAVIMEDTEDIGGKEKIYQQVLEHERRELTKIETDVQIATDIMTDIEVDVMMAYATDHDRPTVGVNDAILADTGGNSPEPSMTPEMTGSDRAFTSSGVGVQLPVNSIMDYLTGKKKFFKRIIPEEVEEIWRDQIGLIGGVDEDVSDSAIRTIEGDIGFPLTGNMLWLHYAEDARTRLEQIPVDVDMLRTMLRKFDQKLRFNQDPTIGEFQAAKAFYEKTEGVQITDQQLGSGYTTQSIRIQDSGWLKIVNHQRMKHPEQTPPYESVNDIESIDVRWDNPYILDLFSMERAGIDREFVNVLGNQMNAHTTNLFERKELNARNNILREYQEYARNTLTPNDDIIGAALGLPNATPNEYSPMIDFFGSLLDTQQTMDIRIAQQFSEQAIGHQVSNILEIAETHYPLLIGAGAAVVLGGPISAVGVMAFAVGSDAVKNYIGPASDAPVGNPYGLLWQDTRAKKLVHDPYDEQKSTNNDKNVAQAFISEQEVTILDTNNSRRKFDDIYQRTQEKILELAREGRDISNDMRVLSRVKVEYDSYVDAVKQKAISYGLGQRFPDRLLREDHVLDEENLLKTFISWPGMEASFQKMRNSGAFRLSEYSQAVIKDF